MCTSYYYFYLTKDHPLTKDKSIDEWAFDWANHGTSNGVIWECASPSTQAQLAWSPHPRPPSTWITPAAPPLKRELRSVDHLCLQTTCSCGSVARPPMPLSATRHPPPVVMLWQLLPSSCSSTPLSISSCTHTLIGLPYGSTVVANEV